ncbi:Uncharacterised protein [uncultured Clostridium sp.]|nr:Uncharacterised protein [uncultured Clostridium sp.]
MTKYSDLYNLIEQDPKASEFYETLPFYVKQAMGYRADHINSYESLCDYADNLTRGDI